MATREHVRARHALETVKAVENESFGKEYRSYVDRLGPAILRNGLGQALAGELASAGDKISNDRQKAHKRLYENISGWLCGDAGIYRGGDLLAALVRGDEKTYLAAHAEALAWLEWHKRFCRAYLRQAAPAEVEQEA